MLIFLFQTIINATRPVITLSADEFGASIIIIGILASSFVLLPLIFSIQVGKLIDKFGDRVPVIFGFIAAIAGIIVRAIFTISPFGRPGEVLGFRIATNRFFQLVLVVCF